MLFVPGTRSDRFDRAAASDADCVIVDLEDSVPAADKDAARDAVAGWLESGQQAIVRVNAAGTPWHLDDCRMAAELGCSVLLPKTDRVEVLTEVRAMLRTSSALVALVETARGVRDVSALCASGAADRVAFGSVDFAVELGIDPARPSTTLQFARSAIVVASAAASLPPPLDRVTTALDDPERLTADLADAVSLGFGGKLAVHPDQVAAINQAWTPTAEEVNWARRVLAATDTRTGVASVAGEMVDLPVLVRAERIVARAATTPGGAP